MKVLVTGRGSSGSWKIRGEQIGRALGALVKPLAGLSDMRAADVILVVKRVPDELLANLRRSGRPWVYDIVDAYPQPECSTWSKERAIEWARGHVQHLRPAAVIWPNARMRDDCNGDTPGGTVYHHCRPGMGRNPIRERIRTIGYEGSDRYIREWLPVIDRECRARGARFVMNPPELATLDVVLALRGGERDCYATRQWKSNVKLANAHGSGTPFIGATECGYWETRCGAEYFADKPHELGIALDWIEEQSARREIGQRFFEARLTLEHQAAQTRAILESACGSRS